VPGGNGGTGQIVVLYFALPASLVDELPANDNGRESAHRVPPAWHRHVAHR
jgi:hypothetical protein